jgi:lysophospholipase L1-like esterase
MAGDITENTGNARILFALMVFLGLGLLALALLCNGTLIDWAFRPWGGLLDRVAERVPAARLKLALGGLALLAGGFLLRQIGFFRWSARSGLRVNLVLLAAMLLTAVFTMEQVLSIRFYRDNSRATTIFARDPNLGWRLKPGARGSWGMVPTTINAHGMRGAEVPEGDGADQFRLLFLGDSVTFGYRVRDDEPFPLLTGQNLNSRSPERMVVPLNAGVDGYSPWQEYELLVRYGLDLEPDLVLVCFVLNDVTEKFSLVQFGGSELGFQVRHTVEGLGDRMAGWSHIFNFGSYIRDRIRFGGPPADAARELEKLQVMDLLYDEKKELTDRAWALTLANLDKIFLRCQEEKIPALLVILPYAFQLQNPPAFGRPQTVLRTHAAGQGIDTVDLLPLLCRDMEERKLGIPAYFLDDNHLTAEGHRTVARILADEIYRRGLTGGLDPLR